MAFVQSPVNTLKSKLTAFHGTAVSATHPPRLSSTPKRHTLRTRITPQCSDMGVSFPSEKFDDNLRIGIISTRWNSEYVEAMTEQVCKTLGDKEIKEENIVRMQVAGAWELPMAARLMCAAQKVDAVVTLGVLIKGDTEHYEYLAGPVSHGLMDLQLQMSVPVVFGVLCCTTEQQAADRSTGDKCKAENWALTAIEMAQLRKSQTGGVSAGKKSVGFF